MQINMNFEVEAKCYEFSSIKELKNIENYRTATIEKVTLKMNKFDAANFLYRFSPSSFNIGDYKIALRFDENHSLSGIMMKNNKSNNIFLVINFDDLLYQINEAFIRIRTLEKMGALLELDFEDSIKMDNDGLLDEFDIESRPEKYDEEDTNNENDDSMEIDPEE
jgi:hypothetical protein